MNNQLVSVIIPMFNREQTIERAIYSVLNQSYRSLEVIVVDDGSTDNSVSVVQHLDDDRIHLFCLDHNMGVAYARNEGIKQAKGEIIAFQDSDDEWLETKLEIQINYMNQTGVEACFCPFFRYEHMTLGLIPNPNAIRYETVEQNLLKILAFTNIIGTPTLVLHRKVIDSVGVFDTNMPKMEDYEYILRIVKKFKMGFVKEPLVKTYALDDSLNLSKSDFEAWNVILHKHGDLVLSETAIHHLYHRGVILNSHMVDEMWPGENVCYRNMIIDYYGDELQRLREEMQKSHYESISLYKAFRKHASDIYIYGAGKIGRLALRDLLEHNCQVKGFIVSHYDDELRELEGFPIVEIDDVNDRDINILVAVGPKIRFEIIQLLMNKGFCRFSVYAK